MLCRMLGGPVPLVLCAFASSPALADPDALSAAPTYRTQTVEYHNRDYYRQGLVVSADVADASGAVFTRSQTDYRVVRVSDQAQIPAPSLAHVRLDNQEQTQTSHDWTYRYLSHRPHAPTHIGQATYQFDAAGNRTHWTKQDPNATPMHALWDTDDRLQALYTGADPGDTTAPAPPPLAEYRYDDAGLRKIKRVAAPPPDPTNPSPPSTDVPGDVYYVNAWFTVQIPKTEPGGPSLRKRNTYIMDGARRIAAKLNTPSAQCGAATPDQPDPYTVHIYHTDHLGSTSYLSNKCAELIEHTEYFPYGQPWVDESIYSANNNPEGAEDYKFTGKELDQESGLYYYGARYYEPDTGIWMSADPILSSYMDGNRGMGGVYQPKNLSLYSQSFNNPVVYLDPDGRAVFFALVPLIKPAAAAIAGGAALMFGNISTANAPDIGEATTSETTSILPVDLAAGAIRDNCGAAVCDGTAIALEFGFNPFKAASGGVDAVRRMATGDGAGSAPSGRSADDVFGNRTVLENKTSRNTSIERIPGGNRGQADADFDQLDLSDVKDINGQYGPGRVGTLPDNTKAIVRPSRDGRPTIEFQNERGRTTREIRYGEQGG